MSQSARIALANIADAISLIAAIIVILFAAVGIGLVGFWLIKKAIWSLPSRD